MIAVSAVRAWSTIVLAGVGTFAMRLSFLGVAHRLVTIPDWAQRVLRQIPPAALAALVVPALVRPGGQFDLWQPRLAAGIIAAGLAWRTKSSLVTIGGGMLALVVIEALTVP